MSPADRRYWQLAHRRVASLEGDVRAALLRAFAIVRDSLSEAELVRLVASGQLETILTRVFSEEVFDRAFAPYRARLRDTTEAAFTYTVRELPRAGKVDGVLAVSFDTLNEDIITALKTLDTRVMTDLKSGVRESVREAHRIGIEAGQPHRSIARGIRESVGLGPEQVKQVAGFRDALMGVEGKDVSSYTLRNRTVDRLLAKGPLSAEQVDRYTNLYQRARVAQNAVSVSKTATLDSYKEGQRLSWKTAEANGVIPSGFAVQRIWTTVGDSRVRPEHVKMAGEAVGMDERFSNGELTPGESTYGCRCLARMKVVKAGRVA